MNTQHNKLNSDKKNNPGGNSSKDINLMAQLIIRIVNNSVTVHFDIFLWLSLSLVQ